MTRRSSLAVLASAFATACSPLRLINTLAPDRLVARDVPYGDGARRTLDVYAPPPGRIAPDGASVLMFLYGGSWNSGAKTIYRFVGGAFAEAGYVTVIPDYRLYPEVRYPAFLDDNAAALAWTIANASRFGGDALGGAFLLGHSAGAYNAAMLTLDPAILARADLAPAQAIRATIGLAGPYDFLPFDSDLVRAVFLPASSDPKTTQPIDHVTRAAPPMMLATGLDDTTVRPANTRHLADRIREVGGTVVEHAYPGIGHREIIGAIATPLRFLAPVFRDSLIFLRAPAQTARTQNRSI